MELLSLDLDVLNCVLDHLIQRDLKSLRLVNRALYSHIKLKIPRLFISPNRTNIDVFESVINHEEYRLQVREIVWDDARLEYFSAHRGPRRSRWQVDQLPRDFDHFVFKLERQDERNRFRSIVDLRKKELWGLNAEEMSIEESFRVYRQLWDDQQRIIQNGEDVKALRQGLLRLSNLKRITLTSEAWRMYYLFPKYETPFFRSLLPGQRMVYPWAWLGHDSYQDEDEDDYNRRLQTPWTQPHDAWRGYSIIVAELLSARHHSNICEFIIDVHREHTGIGQRLFCAPSLDLTGTETLFSVLSLTRLDLAINTQGMDPLFPDTWFWRHPYLKRALSQLDSLKHFVLRLSTLDHWAIGIASHDYPLLSLQDILPTPHGTVWPHLQYLGLAYIFTTQESLLILLSTLPSLVEIDLDSCRFQTGHESYEIRYYPSLLNSIKTDLLDTDNGAWKTRKPRLTMRYGAGRLSNQVRTTCFSNTIGGYLYGDRPNPYELLEDRVETEEPLAWEVHDFDPEPEDPDQMPEDPTKEIEEQNKYRNLLLYPPPIVIVENNMFGNMFETFE
ncbi:hypothetical protein K504DRAFT_494448 [Pleomassaria siparia CBS 279.74]|uniref:F-box domain-containing protein n=1 Tax=Pleomassaria siparia CBS 279.74 TaxID=1314801 RepID=A0A6G1JX28_9PLEO|nr:hypothetical protein K504DRAFT_494448 [Pleomassaria siparia CBS 279.74]